MKNGTEKCIKTVKYLGNLYDFINLKLFNNELIKPIITIQRDERNKTYGWWSIRKVWKENDNDEGEHELNITAQFLNRPIQEIAATMIHEMCHQYASVHNVQDTSRNHVYHNKLYKKIAESHGLIIEYIKTYGWTLTKLSDDSEKLISEFIKDNPLTIIYRLPVIKGQTVRTSSTRKYVCPVCGQSVRATKSVNIMCLDCNEPMQEELL